VTEKADFNPEEWSTFVEAPELVALRVIAAERGGTLRASLSLERAYSAARRGHQGPYSRPSVLGPQIDPRSAQGPQAVTEQANRALRK
jgi:hypothetical protein